MYQTSQEYKRRLLLWTSAAYGGLVTAVPTASIVHAHLAPNIGVATGLVAVALITEVLGARELGARRGRLASGLLLAGPLGPVLLSRRTRRWQPLMSLRPSPRMRR